MLGSAIVTIVRARPDNRTAAIVSSRSTAHDTVTAVEAANNGNTEIRIAFAAMKSPTQRVYSPAGSNNRRAGGTNGVKTMVNGRKTIQVLLIQPPKFW